MSSEDSASSSTCESTFIVKEVPHNHKRSGSMASLKIVIAAVLVALMAAAITPASAQNCVGTGLSIQNTCSAFTSQIKQQASTINSADCATLRSEVQSGKYGTPSARCCSDSNSFFGANCLDQTFIYNQAVGPVGFTPDSLKAAATVSAISCGNGGRLARC
ncbi:g9994 [Coccomyxa elongata]